MWELLEYEDHEEYDDTEEDENTTVVTERLKVPGGWIVRTIIKIIIDEEKPATSISQTFVSDPEHTWPLKVDQ